ncbi:hybrid sensor histidine kinase/response regulator [Arenibacter aquaticus]|uniref:histidine kinase n=1 Tax=Arenibacter aquaticus TaxID=2489054 RepID=A0A3S0CMK1_9FLAO|nr:two-component regulator propeller domain-containing protein [Arenibacter aquaticus]RTE54773.1 hybrid sensor histidine kinase/response regulator [Arenibacter aquaticus]
MIIRICTFFLVCCLPYSVWGQFKNLKFENLNTIDGLSSSTCTTIFQDSDGFMWFGTIDGLNKYNGYEFEIYRSILNDSTSIGNNRINTITEDKFGNLWVGTSNGLNFLDKTTYKFHRINLYGDQSLSKSPRKIINDLLYSPESNNLWVATNNGVIKIDLTNNPGYGHPLEISYYLNEASNPNTLDNNSVNFIIKDRKNALWFVTNGQYLNRYNPQKNNFDRVHINVSEPYELNHIPKNVFIDYNDDFWIGNNLSNIILWSREDNSFSHLSLVEGDIPVRDFYQDKNGTVWVTTDGHGLFLFNKDEKINIQNILNDPFDSFSLPNNKPSVIYQDKSGILWIGSYDKGVSKLDPSKYSFGHYYYQPNNEKGLNEKIVQAVLEDSKERIWISAYNGGLNLFNEEQLSYTHYSHDPKNPNSLSSNKILYTFESSDGAIWICTLDGGVNKFNPELQTFKRFVHKPADPNSIGESSVWTGVEDDKNRLWFGLRTEGLSLLNPNTGHFNNYKNTVQNENGLASNFVFCLFIDSKNRLLIGTSLGLNYLDLDQLEEYAPEQIQFQQIQANGIEGTGINYITEDHVGNIWLGTDSGIFKLDGDLKLIKSYTTKNELPNNLVVGIKEDESHKLWITSKSGLSLLNPNTDQFRNFNEHDGLQGLEYQSKSIEKLHDGRILIGGINGFNLFDPNNFGQQSVPKLSPQLSSFKLNNTDIYPGDSINGRVLLNKSINETKKLSLNYNENYISFEFVALHFENPELIQYAYKMHGLDDSFIDTGSNRVVNLSNLEPGNYIFEVKASLDGQWDNADSSKIALEILPPFWKTWWMKIIYIIVGGLLFWALINYYTLQVKASQRSELDQMKLEFFVNVSHEFRTPLTLILNPVDKILGSVSDSDQIKTSALTIQRSARRLLHLVNQLLDYRKMDVGMSPLQLEQGNIIKFCEDIFSLFVPLAAKKDLDYKFESNTQKITTLFDFDKVEKIITNLISNAIKFTKRGGTITVMVNKKSSKGNGKRWFWSKKERLKDYVEIVISDNGVGLEKEQLKNIFSRFYHPDSTTTGTGIGLNFTKALIEIHGGEITVESRPKKGSTFTVKLPINLDSEWENVENVKNEFLINSMNAVDYEMSIVNDESSPSTKKDLVSDSKRSTILIVEDNSELRKHLVKDLQNDYIIKEAANGVKGLTIAQKAFPDLIISDVMMPKMDGFELCKEIKTNFDTCHIPVLLLTARSLDNDKVEGYKSGADGYLSKPFVTSVLKARISNLLAAKNRLRERFSEIGGLIPSAEVTTNNMDEVFLDKATKIILENINNVDFKQEDLSKELGIGRSQLYRKINSLTGNNPSYFIRSIRLRYASELLQAKQYTIKEVTYMSGFNSTAYFSKTFKELFNKTPTEFMEEKEKAGEK